mgnify:FL=1
MTFSPAQNTDSEGAILFDLKRFSLDDGPGPRTVLFFQGCPLACPWCHNPEGVPLSGPLLFRKEKCIGCGKCLLACPLGLDGREHPIGCTFCGDCAKACVTEALIQLGRFYPFQEIYETIGRDLDLLLEGGGGVTATGGESLLQLPALVEIFRWCKNRGIHTLLETSGHGADNLEELLEVTDEVYLDLKFPDAARYKEIGGKLDLVRAFAEKIAQAKIPLSIRMPVIPGYNDSDADLLEAAKLAWSWEGVKNFVLLPYRPWGKDKYQALALPFITENKAMSPQKLREKIAKLEKAGYSATF